MDAQTTRPVVVGYDDSPEGEIALEWAVREAERLDRPLKVVVARGMLWSTAPGFGPAAPWPEDLDREVVVRAKQRVTELSTTVETVTESVVGTPAAVLVTAAEDAEMVVVGRHHHSLLGELVEGSTSAQVVAHARCPVVVVDRHAGASTRAPIVVAVDGSSPNDAALAFAFDRATQLEAPVVAVHAWTLDVPDTFDTAWLRPEHIAELEQHHRSVLDEAVAPWAAKFPDVELRTVLRRNLPVEAVLEQSEGARLIVVGSRGHGGFVGLLVGSVSQGLLHRDRPCPLAVIHAEHREA
ncbi:universal stress protein [Knoellia sp. LjRoot47]|uniref:universal stress protein n=1 Tax=Knoellia sp. LjRoot47 TaxID=3342330 RepID=UPI003ECF6D07